MQTGRPHGDRGRDQNEAALWIGATGSHGKLQTSKDSPLEPSEEV